MCHYRREKEIQHSKFVDDFHPGALPPDTIGNPAYSIDDKDLGTDTTI